MRGLSDRPKRYIVGVAELDGTREGKLLAYTTYRLPSQCQHVVLAVDGTEAKRIAKRDHRQGRQCNAE